MFVFASSLVMDQEAAQDIVQEVWIDYWKRRIEINPEYIKPYLYKAVRNNSYKHFRNTKLNAVQLEVLQSVSTLPEIEEQFAAKDLTSYIRAIIQDLPPRCQEIFKLSRWDGLANEEIAHKLGISKRSVENQLSIALKKIKNEYSPT